VRFLTCNFLAESRKGLMVTGRLPKRPNTQHQKKGGRTVMVKKVKSFWSCGHRGVGPLPLSCTECPDRSMLE